MSTIPFKASLVTINNWTILKLPHDVSSRLPSRGQVMIKGTIDGIHLLAPVEPDGKAGHWLHIDADLLKATGLHTGDTATLTIEATKDWPEPKVPADFKAALTADTQAGKQYASVTPMARWEWIRWINATAQEKTRMKRIEVSCSKLRRGERRPCCFNRSMCCVPEVSKNGILLEPVQVT